MDVLTPTNENDKLKKIHLKLKPLTLLVRKYDSNEIPKKIIKSEISNFFNSPDKYFDLNSCIQINKRLNKKKLFPLDSLTHKNKQLNIKELIKSARNNSSKLGISYREKHQMTNITNNKDNNNPTIRKNFVTIDNENLKNIFKSYKNNFKVPKKKGSNNLLYNISSSYSNRGYNSDNIPRDLSLSLNVQNRRLLNKKNSDRQNRNLSKYLSRKLRKNESDLLINGVHLYRFKKEILDNDEDEKNNKKKITEQSSSFRWISSLRRYNNFYGRKESYLNVGSENNPLWSIVVERYPVMKEMSVKAGYNLNSKNFRDFKRRRNLSSLNSERLENFENLDKVNIKGKKLFNVEYNREMSNSNNKILHKVFVDNGKVILYKDVNKIFGDKTIYKDYNNSRNNEDKLFASKSLDIYLSNNSSFIK